MRGSRSDWPWYLEYLQSRSMTGTPAAFTTCGLLLGCVGFGFFLGYVFTAEPGLGGHGPAVDPPGWFLLLAGVFALAGGVALLLGLALAPRRADDEPAVAFGWGRGARWSAIAAWLSLVAPLVICAAAATRSAYRGRTLVIAALITVLTPVVMRAAMGSGWWRGR